MDRQGLGAYIPQELLKEISKASNRLLIGIPCERVEGERRLALTPEAVDMLIGRGHRVLVEAGAGLGINYSDNHYSEAGAEIVATPAEVYQADIILKILPPLTAEVMMMKPRTTLFSTVQFNTFSHEAFELMMAKRITAIAYELLADDMQRCPVLNVISEIEGTASITIASELLSNTQGGKGILLGGIPGVSPTEVVVIGAGNAGTVATRAAMALGASVKVFDDDINKLRTIQQVLGQGLFTSTFHPNVLQNAFRSADVVIGAMRYINTRRRYIIAEDMIRLMKRVGHRPPDQPGRLFRDDLLPLSFRSGCFRAVWRVALLHAEHQQPCGAYHFDGAEQYLRPDAFPAGRCRCRAGDDQERSGVQERSLYVLRKAR